MSSVNSYMNRQFGYKIVLSRKDEHYTGRGRFLDAAVRCVHYVMPQEDQWTLKTHPTGQFTGYLMKGLKPAESRAHSPRWSSFCAVVGTICFCWRGVLERLSLKMASTGSYRRQFAGCRIARWETIGVCCRFDRNIGQYPGFLAREVNSTRHHGEPGTPDHQFDAAASASLNRIISHNATPGAIGRAGNYGKRARRRNRTTKFYLDHVGRVMAAIRNRDHSANTATAQSYAHVHFATGCAFARSLERRGLRQAYGSFARQADICLAARHWRGAAITDTPKDDCRSEGTIDLFQPTGIGSGVHAWL